MVSIEEYIKFRNQPLDYDKILEGVEGRALSLTVKRIFNYKTYGDYIDDDCRTSWLAQLATANINKIFLEKLGLTDKFADMLNDWENCKRKPSCLNHMGRAIHVALSELEEQRCQLIGEEKRPQRRSMLGGDTTATFSQPSIFDAYAKIKAKGISALEDEPCEDFGPRKRRYKYILRCVETYLNDLSKQMVEEKKPKDEIEKTVNAKMAEFNALVQRKREQLEHIKENGGFLSQMATKIGEVKKYKRNTQIHKEEKEHNPFYNDGQTI